jgi:nucleotide-binding universal stress UspA family protein
VTQAALLQHARVAATVTEELIERARRLTGRRAEELTAVVEQGAAYAEIVRSAEELGADLVVVGGAGERGWRTLVLGRVATQVVRAAHTSVLVARPRPSGGPVVAATDFSEQARRALAQAAEEARRFRRRLLLVHSLEWFPPATVAAAAVPLPAPIFEPELRESLRKRTRRQLEDELAKAGTSGEAVVAEGPAAAGIVDLATKARADLVVLGTLGRTGLRRVLLGSVAEEVARDAPCPVLVVRAAH